VDDDADTRELYGLILRSHGYEVVDAVDGAQALEHIAARAADLVITDVRMPRVDGLEVCRAAKAARPRALPVLVITALASAHVIELAKESGADVILVKPVTPTDVVDEVSALLRRYHVSG
jgi:two-component system OmpR family response regulator